MKNTFINKFKSSILIKVKGKNIERFIKRLISNKIEILDLKYIKYNEVIIKIYKEDYKKVKEIKTIYDIFIVDSYGLIKIKKVINMNKFMIISLIIGFSLLLFLTNTIFQIEVVHTDSDIRNMITNALEQYDIKVGKFKKNYDYISNVKEKILTDYKDEIEWLEIENIGVKYVVRLELRKLPEQKETIEKRHIIAGKDAIIKIIESSSGQIIKNKNDYVHKGDIVISGAITLNEETKENVGAIGKVYGEVWYKTTIEYPLMYKEDKETGNKKTVYVLKILNNEIELFNFNKFKNKKVKSTPLLSNNLLPIRLEKQEQSEIEKLEFIYTEEEAVSAAVNMAKEKIESKLSDKERILSEKTLNINEKDSKMVVEMFFTVLEDITDYQKIEEINETKEELKEE